MAPKRAAENDPAWGANFEITTRMRKRSKPSGAESSPEEAATTGVENATSGPSVGKTSTAEVATGNVAPSDATKDTPGTDSLSDDGVEQRVTQAGSPDDTQSTVSTHSDNVQNVGAPSSSARSDDLNIRSMFSKLDHVPDDVIRRLLAFAQKQDHSNRRYALSKIPENATWGTHGPNEKYLCVDEEPITIWHIGNTDSPWFTDAQGNPVSRVNIGVRAPFNGDWEYVQKLYEKGRPKRDDQNPLVYSAKLMGQRKSKIGPSNILFQNIYDRTGRFKAKSGMPLLPSSAIGKRDIVLVESSFTRWKTDTKRSSSWVKWNVALELQAVTLLWEAPADIPDEPEALPDDIDDDM